jgi:CDP-glycerol glycerophosphotransferase (TagB/SpsB family)
LPNIRIDLGSMAAADMTYTMGADLYLGDVSSQVAEFLTRPRPCLFLNAHHAEWNGNPDYRFWQLGPVVEDIRDLGPELDRAFATHEQYRQRQVDYVEETFGTLGQPTSAKAADAIVAYLRSQQR